MNKLILLFIMIYVEMNCPFVAVFTQAVLLNVAYDCAL